MLITLIACLAILISGVLIFFFIESYKVRSLIAITCLLTSTGIAILFWSAFLFKRARFRKELQRSGRMSMIIEKCPNCGRDYPVRDDVVRCPSCGGDLTLHRTVLARNEGKISMDEKEDNGVS